MRPATQLARPPLLPRGRTATRRQPRLPVGLAQTAQGQLPHATRPRRGGAATSMTSPPRAKPFVTRCAAASSRQAPAATIAVDVIGEHHDGRWSEHDGCRCRRQDDGWSACCSVSVQSALVKPSGVEVSSLGRPVLVVERGCLREVRRSPRRLVGGNRGWWCVVSCLLCARAPSLISVHDPGWFRTGDMMFDGV